MDRKKIERKVKEILADRLDIPIEKIKLNSKLVDDLGMDSFGAVEVMFAIKDMFSFNISDEDFRKVETVKDIVEYILIKK